MDFQQAAQAERIRSAHQVLTSPTLAIETLSRYRRSHFGQADAWAFLDQMDGVELATLPADTASTVSQALSSALEIPPIYVGDGKRAAQDLDAIRLGQPTPALMTTLSKPADEARRYLEHRFQLHFPTTKLVVGEMGEGKTTFLQLIDQLARAEGAEPISITVHRSGIFRTANVSSDMIFRPELIRACLAHITQLRTDDAVDARHLQSLVAITHGHLSGPAFEALIHQGVQLGADAAASDITNEAAQFSHAMSHWARSNVDSRLTPLKEYMANRGAGRSIQGPFDPKDTLKLFKVMLRFLKACDVYPVWLIDEFESYGALNAPKTQACLGLYREMLDAIHANVDGENIGTGALFFFSTGDGVNTIRSYPALYDRLRASHHFGVHNPTWHMHEFSRWSFDEVMEVIKARYIGGASTGDPVCEAVHRNLDLLDTDAFRAAVKPMLENPYDVPRNRLKTLTDLIDQLGLGRDHFTRMIEDAQEPTHSNATLNALFPDIDIDEVEVEDIGQANETPNSVADPEPHATQVEGRDPEDNSAPMSSPRREFALNLLKNGRKERMQTPPADHQEAAPATQRPDTHPMLPYQPRSSYITWEGLEQTLATSRNRSHVARKVSAYRDQGGCLEDLRHLLPEGMTLAKNNDHQALKRFEDASRELLEKAFSNRGSLTAWISQKADKEDINPDHPKGSKRDLPILPFLPLQDAETSDDKPASACQEKLSEKEGAESIHIFESLGMLRHCLYCNAADSGELPCDEWMDDLVMNVARAELDYRPRSSRTGIIFKQQGKGIARLLSSGKTSFSDEPIPRAGRLRVVFTRQ